MTQPKTHIRVLVLDTETTGKLPKHQKGTPFPPSEAYPYITQISWVMYNVERDFVEETFDSYIQVPAEIPITEEITRITGITREIIDKKGKPLTPILVALYRAYIKCSCVIAHNISFDSQVIRQEIYRNKDAIHRMIGPEITEVRGLFTKAFNEINEVEMVCTMMSSIELCGIEFPAIQGVKSNKKKFPTLTELYTKLFNQPLPENMHNSIIDVLVCLRCFLKLRGFQELPDRKFELLVQKAT